MTQRRVVITGIGAVTSAGVGAEKLFSALCRTTCLAQPIPERFLEYYSWKSRYHVPAPEINFSWLGLQSPMAGIVGREDVMTLAAAKCALDDAGIKVVPETNRFSVEEVRQCHVVIGTGMGDLERAFHSYAAHSIRSGDSVAAFSSTPLRYGRMVVPQTMPSSVAAWVSILFGINGPTQTVNASCASGTVAVGEAFRRVRHGYCDTALAGGVEYLYDSLGTIMRGFDMLGVLTRSQSGRPMPFSPGRSGFLFSQGGACILVLEDKERAVQRGARIYAEVADYQSNSDAYSIVQTDPSGAGMIQLLSLLSRGKRIDYLNTHGTGTQANDKAEAHAIRSVFGTGSSQPICTADKGLLGHTIGAAGALETAITAMSIHSGTIHGNDVDESIEGLNLPRRTFHCALNRAITVSYGFGGHNAGLVLERSV